MGLPITLQQEMLRTLTAVVERPRFREPAEVPQQAHLFDTRPTLAQYVAEMRREISDACAPWFEVRR